MSDVVIRVENLSKAYRIGLRERRYDTLGGRLASWVRAPLNNFRALRSLSNIKDGGDSADIIWALRHVGFETKEGEVIGIIGKNGAGKSTLLKILARITEPTDGKAEIWGRIGSLLEVGTGFNPELTGRENVYLNGTILGMTKREVDHKFDMIVDFSGIEKFIDTPVKRYSSGMRVRLAFAVAAHLEPEILFIDEVLAVGDEEFQKKCLGKMDEVAKRGRTILFVSHNLAAVGSLCHRGLVLNNGQLTFLGDVKDAIDHYLNKTALAISDPEIPGNISSVSTGEAKFTSIRLVDDKNQTLREIRYRQKLRFALGLRVFQRIRDVIIEIVISNRSGVPILYAISNMDNSLPLDLGEGDYEFEVEADNSLLPNDYLLSVFLDYSSGHVIDSLDHICGFSVLKTAEEKTRNYKYRWVLGHVGLESKWRFQKKP